MVHITKRRFEALDDYAYVNLWAEEDGGLRITVTEEDEFGDTPDLGLEDALAMGRKVRELAKWAASPDGKRKIAKVRHRYGWDMPEQPNGDGKEGP